MRTTAASPAVANPLVFVFEHEKSSNSDICQCCYHLWQVEGLELHHAEETDLKSMKYTVCIAFDLVSPPLDEDPPVPSAGRPSLDAGEQ